MDKELKAKWVEALRSGDYQQGRKKLRDGDKFCCLGVLCNVVNIPMDSEGMWPIQPDGRVGYEPIWSLIGGEYRDLPHMNDKGKSFSYLADYIEKNL